MDTKLLSALLIVFSSMTAHAANLTTAGNNLVYDSASNISWTQDGNLLATLESGDPGLINTIISDIVGITDTSVYHTLTSSDYGSNGLASWWGAEAFVSYLNLTSYEGYTNWTLPTNFQNTTLFNANLGEALGSSIASSHNADYNLFSNVQTYVYWSDTVYSNTSNKAVIFNTVAGYQGNSIKESLYNAWAVLPGNVAPVPVPSAAWLFGSGLIGLVGSIRKGKAV